ncbi:DctP family TRAP transporter solute-binding subunit [Thalassospira lucentensis]|uniref:C4-dicarboxylate ABC transporter substrate-binding protein n=1 Tax=Thalassospira lucentensis TaxID=168935 RepID=A0A358HWV7_9PROT|nr:DctP family TRAP transporter solute-binding subunit [Thalassospira lucentensis]HBU99663.1 C4-dicarboxylate ABC transporter substrate-binding protein [Thalassospira lucentensis]HCW69765.1 C4-dicarboxylate ABC transporter substrate-binding protein [Thalassospira lucentensis]
MKMISKGALFGAVSMAAASFGFSAHAADVTLNFAHVDPAEWTTSKKGAASQVFKNIVEAESGGRIEVALFPAGSLGGETDLLQNTQDGTLAMSMVSGPFSKVCPEAAVLDVPYIFPNANVAWSVLDGDFGKELAAHCLEKTGLRTLAYGETGFRNFTNSKRAVAQPSDMEGLKIRVMTVPLFVEMVKALGGEPTPIPWPEVPTALTTGTVDGQENPISVIYANKFYEMQKYLTLDRHVYGTDFIVVNEAIYQDLSEADQALLRRAAGVASNVGRAIQQFNSAEGVAKLAEEGMEVTTPTAEQLKAFRDAAQPAVIEWLSGQIDAQWIEKLQAAVVEAEASM